MKLAVNCRSPRESYLALFRNDSIVLNLSTASAKVNIPKQLLVEGLKKPGQIVWNEKYSLSLVAMPLIHVVKVKLELHRVPDLNSIYNFSVSKSNLRILLNETDVI